MYLVCCPNVHIASMLDELATIHLSGIGLPLMDFNFDPHNLKFLEENIDQFDYVIIPSPAVIDYAKDAITKASIPTFITVGKSSRDRICRLSSQPVIFPEVGSGGLALFNEKLYQLDLFNKKVLVVKGDGGNDDLYLEMTKHNIKWTTLELYKRVLHELDADYLKKLLIIEGLQGIIITTSILAEWLFKQAEKAHCTALLRSCLFIVIHPQIEQKLKDFGAARVLVTPDAGRSAVIELIKEFI